MALQADDTGRGVSLEKVLAEIKGGKASPCYLLWGDEEFRLQDALDKIVKALIPDAGDRDLNLFVTDGEREDVDALCESLCTSPLLPGRKVVAVRNTRLFQSKNVLAPLIARIRERLEQDPLKAAADFRRFMQITGLQWEELRDGGWRKIDDETWRRIVPDDGGEGRETWLPKIVEILGSHEPEPLKERQEETDRLERTLMGGMPADNHLILTAETVDRRKKLFKTFSATGRILSFTKGKGEARQQTVQEMAFAILERQGKRLSAGGWAALGRKTGFDLRESLGAIEKLITYVGDKTQIEPADVEAVIGRTKEDTVFELTGALSARNLVAALATLRELLDQGLHPLMIMTMLTREIRFLFQAKLLIASGRLKGFQANMDYGRFQKQVLPGIKQPVAAGEEPPAVASQHPFVVYQAFKNAERFTQRELAADLELLFKTDLALKSTGHDPRLLLERVLMTICGSR
ncbi:MAG: DNA polymerase III subunit delta [Deltaproteobacteria bacterium]|nr:DNA polymerase III subunit delta [Deltaproteobacteria bacterium]